MRGLCLALAASALAACSAPRWPVDAPMTSPYGLRFMGLRPDIHRGVDLDVPEGTSVRAMKDGRVRFAGVMDGYGNVVWLEHGKNLLTIYAHLSQIRTNQGDMVDAGTVIGLSGASGDATGPHLHFEVWRWGREVDPVPFLGGRPGGPPDGRPGG